MIQLITRPVVEWVGIGRARCNNVCPEGVPAFVDIVLVSDAGEAILDGNNYIRTSH